MSLWELDELERIAKSRGNQNKGSYTSLKGVYKDEVTEEEEGDDFTVDPDEDFDYAMDRAEEELDNAQGYEQERKTWKRIPLSNVPSWLSPEPALAQYERDAYREEKKPEFTKEEYKVEPNYEPPRRRGLNFKTRKII